MMVYPSRAVGDAVRLYAETLDVPYGEYIASVLAERFGHPYWAAPEVRQVDGGLASMIRDANIPRHEPAADSWDDRDVFVTKPVKALGTIIRDFAAREGKTLTRVITDELALFHGIDQENRIVLGKAVAEEVEVVHDKKRKREVLRLMA